MSTLGEIRDAIGAALADIPARIQVALLEGKYDEGVEKFGVNVVVGEPTPEAEELLDELLLADGPVLTALGADPTLGGVVQALAVRSHAGYRPFPQPDETVLLGTRFVLEIYR